MERLCEEADNWPRGFVLETFRQAFLQLFFQTDQNCLLHKIQEDNVYIIYTYIIPTVHYQPLPISLKFQ